LQPTEHFALLWDAKSLRWLHHEFLEFCRRPASQLHPWWKERLKEVVESIGLTR
jgi:hypothetical protein